MNISREGDSTTSRGEVAQGSLDNPTACQREGRGPSLCTFPLLGAIQLFPWATPGAQQGLSTARGAIPQSQTIFWEQIKATLSKGPARWTRHLGPGEGWGWLAASSSRDDQRQLLICPRRWIRVCSARGKRARTARRLLRERSVSTRPFSCSPKIKSSQ